MMTFDRPVRQLSLAALALSLAAPLAACGDDADEPHDAGTTTDAEVSDTADADAGAGADVAVDTTPDVPTGTQTLGGSIFNNTDMTEGTLRVALVPADDDTGEPIAELEDDAPLFSYSWQFDDVPLGNYYVVALLDVDEPNEVTDPGPGDLAGRTEDPAGGFEDGASNTNVNVEIR